MPSSVMLRSVALVRTDVLEKRVVSIMRLEKVRMLGKTLAGNSNRVIWIVGIFFANLEGILNG
jgi:hypothetical protein